MTKTTKATVLLLSLMLSVGFSAAQAQTVPHRLQVYAGPQTVTPGQNISVTIEIIDGYGESYDDEPIQLNYTVDGISTSLWGGASNGLVSFDVQAQARAGRMTFTARSGGEVSNNAPVLVVAAQPRRFELRVAPSRNANLVKLTTDIIKDVFDNPVSDQTLVTLDWIDRIGVKRSEAVQLTNGRISYVSMCPNEYKAPLKIRAVLKNVDVFSSDISVLCGWRKDRS